jgi:GIY-YIG catalytic domain
MKIYGIIYKLTNKVTKKCYVGKTTQTLRERLTGHLSNYTKCNYVGASLKKHGISNFIVEEVYTSFTKNDLAEKEEYFIKLNNSVAPSGYNILNGSKVVKNSKTHKQLKLASESNLGWARVRPIKAYNVHTGKSYFFSRIVDAVKKTGLSKSIIEKNISFNRVSKGYVFSYANQSGSVLFKNTTHAQRLGVEPANAEYNTPTSIRVPRCYEFSQEEISLITKLYQTKSYREVAREIGVSEARCARLLRKFGIMRSNKDGLNFRDKRRNVRNIR